MNLQNKMREQLAEMFVNSLSQDQLPWKACWQVQLPENAINGKRYKGINSLMLSYVASQAHYDDHRWCTFRQASEKGWHVKKGAKAAQIEYWAYYDKEKRKMLSWTDAKKVLRENPDYANENLVLRSRVYSVFNGSQIEGIPEISHTHNMSPETIRQQRDTLFRNMNLSLQEGVAQPYYAPEIDTVCLPYEQDFFDSYSYACTMLHECGHATGHESRLNRNLDNQFGTEGYAREELRAEIASAFAAQALGLQLTDEQLSSHMALHTAYIQSWVKSVKEAPEELFKAIKDAEVIANYLIEKGEFSLEKEQDKQEPPFLADEMEYVGRLDFLGFNGAVAESIEYKTEQELVSTVQEEVHAGVPLTLVLYEDRNGNTIPTGFTQSLEAPFMQIHHEKPKMITPKTTEQRIAEAQKLAKQQPHVRRSDFSRSR